MRKIAEFQAHDNYVIRVLFTRDGGTLVTAGMDNLIRLWSLSGWRLVRAFEGHENSVNAIVLTPDETRLVSASTDKRVRGWIVE